MAAWASTCGCGLADALLGEGSSSVDEGAGGRDAAASDAEAPHLDALGDAGALATGDAGLWASDAADGGRRDSQDAGDAGSAEDAGDAGSAEDAGDAGSAEDAGDADPCGPGVCGVVNSPTGAVDCGGCDPTSEECRGNSCVDLCGPDACGEVQGLTRRVECGDCPLYQRCEQNLCVNDPWFQLVQVGLRPYPRNRVAAALDVARDRLVVFGGSTTSRAGEDCDGTGTNVCGGLWLWSLGNSTWSTAMVTPAPIHRYEAKMVHDPTRDRYVMFGGLGGQRNQQGGSAPCEGNIDSYCGLTWTFDPVASAWAVAANLRAGPTPRADHGMVYDAARDRVVLFGGQSSTENCEGYGAIYRCGDTWEWDGASWALTSTVGPRARASFGMAYDAGRGRVVLFGGDANVGTDCAGPGTRHCEDTWEWDGVRWRSVSTIGQSPRDEVRMAYHAGRARVLSYGGRGDDHLGRSTVWADTWEWTGNTWVMIPANGPPARQGALVEDHNRGRVLLFGGSLISGRTATSTSCSDVPNELSCNEVWAYDP